jgi:hypothetical protein
VTDVDDIVRDSFDIIDNDDELYNAYKIYTTQDYLGRTPSGWRSHPSTADVPGATPYDPITGLSTTEVVDVTSIAVTGAKTYAPDSQSQLYMVRCKNRPSDGEEYVQGSLTANDVYQRRLRFSRQAPRQYEFSTGVRGFNWELGQVMYLVHFGNVGGRTPRPVRIMSLDTGPDTLLVRVVAYDLTPLLDS